MIIKIINLYLILWTMDKVSCYLSAILKCFLESGSKNNVFLFWNNEDISCK